MSRGIPPQVVSSAERCSQFSRQRGMRVERVIYTYRTVRSTDGLWHVLSSIQDAGADYSGRTNHLAQHLILNAVEASDFARHGNTPAGVMLGTVCSWGAHDGFCGWLEENPHAVSSEPDATWQFWNAYAGSGYCRLNLCSDAALRGAVLVYGKGLEQQTADEAKQVLCLFAESQAGCPDKGWGTTFTTSLEPNDEMSDFRWIGVAEDSPMLAKLDAAGGRAKITFDTPAPVARQPSSAAAPLSPSAPAAASDPLGNLHKDSSPAIDGPAPVGGGKPPRIPPKRHVPAQKEEPFLKRHRSKLEGAAIALVVLATAGFFLRSLLSEKTFTFQGPLSFQYDGSPKSVVLADEGSVAYLDEQGGANSWSSRPPIDAGRYQIGVEKSSWFGFVKQVVPTGRSLQIEQRRPSISFPEQLSFVTSKGSAKTWPIEPTIVPPEAGAEKTVEYRWIKPSESDWEPQAKFLPGEYEVKVSTRETRNFAAATEVAKFTISVPESPDSKTNLLTELPSIPPAAAPTAPGQSATDVVPPMQDAPSIYYLAPGGDALQLAQGIAGWRSDPEKVQVRDWESGSKNYQELDKKKGVFLTGNAMVKEFDVLGGLPRQRLPGSGKQINSDNLVYLASYEVDPQKVYLIGLRANGDNQGAVNEFLGGGVWVTTTDNVLKLVSRSNFFSAAKLLPPQSKWVLRITKGPYSEDDPLPLTSGDPTMFSLDEEKKTLAMITARCEVLIKKAQEEKSAPPVGNNYFAQNMDKLLEPLQALATEQSAAQPIAKQLVDAIRQMRPPATEQDGSAPDDAAAARLIGGALDCAFDNPEIKPKIQLEEKDDEAAKDQMEDARKKDAGLDWSRVKSPKLLSPDEFETWLLEPRQKPRSVSDIKLKAKEWISYRLQVLKAFDKKQKADSPEVEKALEALKAGIDKCSIQTVNPSQAAPSVNVEQEKRKLDLANRKIKFLDDIGTVAASESAQLQIKFEPSAPSQSVRVVTLLPVVRLGPQQLSQP
jgi:hypothetical protein